MGRLFYKVGDIADGLGESPSLVRFWANKFPKLLKPSRDGKGDRVFTEDDFVMFKKIHYLVKTKGMTLDGAYKRLLADKQGGGLGSDVMVKEKLASIREQLVEVYKSL
ncbi:hypothetical protein B5F83_07740 [Muribaculum sp. An289]|uniref:MerR family transcriptional regulator n=1 Tax=unclassified Muribaculum TaxID=2622126 RepID=UPI000B379314|nr:MULTISPECIES: MerR family transcriptional regulator [unclassified Muribaculum]OUO36676.1 hypothetical protein B5F83_07740 [Muribaculum sp. An289]OUO42363.1 hypothetical protein B5F81_07515 [Muribaculum sp. An287]